MVMAQICLTLGISNQVTHIIVRLENAQKNIFTVMFCNERREQINVNRILKSEGLLARLPGKIQLQENIPVSVYRLTSIIRNRFLNYNETLQSILVDDKISFSYSVGTCDCERSSFRDQHHGHITTGHLRLIVNTPLGILSTLS